MPELWRGGAFVDDPWRFPADGEPVPGDAPAALPKRRYLAAREALAARNAPLGVVLTAGDDLAGLEPDRLALIVVTFPRYADGRPYSLARLLRDRHGYRGELRAAGDVLRDQVGFMLRAGFDALWVTHPGTVEALRAGTIVGVHHHYQPASDEAQARADGPRPWQRRTYPATQAADGQRQSSGNGTASPAA